MLPYLDNAQITSPSWTIYSDLMDSEIFDPKGICRDITGLGRWGNGDVELYMEHTSEVDQIMEIVGQSHRMQAEEA
ncbi:MAG: hypothetical protein K2K90_16715 [Lachnospiraceae bacterium]|nr:hypothetical protein [Lachnospiraceae bacterium]